MITVAHHFAPASVCRALIDCFDRRIASLGGPDAEAFFAHRVLRLHQLSPTAPPDDLGARQMRAIRWLAMHHLRDAFGRRDIYPEETQMVRWSVGDHQPLHLDTTRSTTTYAAILYLNDGFSGGETFFEKMPAVRPQTGMLIGFPGASLRHGVRPVTAGTRMTMPMWFTDIEAAQEA